MRIYTLWHAGDDGEVPWLTDAVDECTIDSNDSPPPAYLEKLGHADVRELIIDVPTAAIRALFRTPSVQGIVINTGAKDHE